MNMGMEHSVFRVLRDSADCSGAACVMSDVCLEQLFDKNSEKKRRNDLSTLHESQTMPAIQAKYRIGLIHTSPSMFAFRNIISFLPSSLHAITNNNRSEDVDQHSRFHQFNSSSYLKMLLFGEWFNLIGIGCTCASNKTHTQFELGQHSPRSFAADVYEFHQIRRNATRSALRRLICGCWLMNVCPFCCSAQNKGSTNRSQMNWIKWKKEFSNWKSVIYSERLEKPNWKLYSKAKK